MLYIMYKRFYKFGGMVLVERKILEKNEINQTNRLFRSKTQKTVTDTK